MSRVRTVRSEQTPKRFWRAPHTVPETLAAVQCLALGEVSSQPPVNWQGWPNGSAVFAKGGRYKGRLLDTPSGRVHVLRWNEIRRAHSYVKLAPTTVAGFLFL